jgi:hypothetical protein
MFVITKLGIKKCRRRAPPSSNKGEIAILRPGGICVA